MWSPTISFCILVALSLAAALFAAKRHGVRASLGVGMAMSVLGATWITLDVGLPLKVCSAVAAVLLLAYCFHSPRQILSNWGILDAIIGALALWHVVVDVYHQGFDWTFMPRAYGEWVLPYAAGRFAMMHRGSIRRLSPWFVGVAVVVGSACVLESVADANLWSLFFTEVTDRVTRPKTARFGTFMRAIGPAQHPIFLAVILMSLAPWCWFCAVSAEASKRRRVLGIVGLVAIVLGILASGSRGPILAILLAIPFGLSVRFVAARWVFSLAAVVGAVLLALNLQTALDWLDDASLKKSRGEVVVLDGESEVYTGTRNRLYVAKVYVPLMLRGGPLGYGTRNVTGFPPNLPGLPSDAATRERLGIVDNSFVLVGLRFGWIGFALLVALVTGSLVLSLSMQRTIETSQGEGASMFALGLACTLMAITVELMTVFFHYDMAFWVLFLCGVVAGLRAYTKRSFRGLEID